MIVTARGWWFVGVVFFLSALSLAASAYAFLFLLAPLLLWFLSSYFVFAFQYLRQVNRIQIDRVLHDDRGDVETLWSGNTYRVNLTIQGPGWSPLVRILDRLPHTIDVISGDWHYFGYLAKDKAVALDYRMECLAAGTIRFEGILLQFTDQQGFFFASQFLRTPSLYEVLPSIVYNQGGSPVVKKRNLLPLLGTHRFHRPGSGSELLDLRDYLPGDPPKTIAWKVSARRDRLITKEFESEVPLRCTFFLDTSQSVRLGLPGQTTLTRMIDITVAMTQMSLLAKDLPGLCLFDEHRVWRELRPNRGKRHQSQIIHNLAEAADLLPLSEKIPATKMLPVIHGFLNEVYPDLLKDDINSFPWWLPLWVPRVAWLRPQVLAIRAKSLFIRCLDVLIFRWKWPLTELTHAIFGRIPPLVSRPKSEYPDKPNALQAVFANQEWPAYRNRKKVAAVLAEHYDLGASGVAWLLEDDSEFSARAQQFLLEHKVPYPTPYYDSKGHYLFTAKSKITVIANALLHAVRRGKDNELFVLMIDLLELDEELEPLLRAVKVALARHHQVVVLFPWPEGMKPPKEIQANKVDLILHQVHSTFNKELPFLVGIITYYKFSMAFQKIKRKFGQVGVPVVCTSAKDSVKLIVNRMENLRSQVRGVR